MSLSGIQGQLLEITVVECTKLKDTEWFSKQDPYVCLEYGNTKFRTRTCTDGDRNPKFQEKFMFTLIEGLREINVVVWNSNTLSYDDFIGSGKVQLHEVLSRGYDDRNWTLHTKTGRYAGEIKLIMHHQKDNKPATSYAPSVPLYGTPSQPHAPPYSVPPMTSPSPSPYPNPAYPSPTTAYPPMAATYSTPNSAYPTPPPDPCVHSHQSYPPPAAYPAAPYPPPAGYPAPSYPPPSAYPPPPYPPPPHAAPYGPPGHYGMYPPPPY